MPRSLMTLFILAIFVLTSCGGSSTPEEDGQTDGDVTADDAHGDTQTDTHPDQTGDQPGDPQQDVHPDAEPDTNPDVAPDVEPDVEPDGSSCVAEGCTVGLGGHCCPGTSPANECDPTDPDCTGMYCINDSDSVCSPHENCYNSVSDCSHEACVLGTNEIFTCGLIETHNCTCVEPECRPECWTDVMIVGWYRPCDGTLIREDPGCAGQGAVCQAICSESEGWYESAAGDLIEWAFCSPYWYCQIIW